MVTASVRGATTPEQIKQTLEERFPDIKVERVEPSPLQGIYTVIAGREIVYVNEHASVLLAGPMIDTRTHDNLTQRRWNELNHVSFSALPLELAIKTVRGSGNRKFAVFADPLCPYCVQLEQDLKDLSDVTIYTFLYPIESLHPGATELATKIWCATDRSGSWEKWMQKRATPKAEACKTDTLVKVGKLADEYKVVATPTIIYPNGTRSPGAVSREQLERALAAR